MGNFPRVGQRCPLCRHEAALLIGRKSRTGQPLETVLCLGCGLARVRDLPTREELAAFYRERYRVEYKGVYEPKPYHVLRAVRLARQRIERLRELLLPAKDILDIGCGGGEFVFLLKASGREACGIEPNLRYGRYARDELGLEVRVGLIEDQQFPERSFDVITMFHVLEHLPEPVWTLGWIRPWLRPGGKVVVEVPNFDFCGMHPGHRFHPAHLYHFNALTLQYCAWRAGYGTVEAGSRADGENLVCVLEPDGKSGPDEGRLRENAERLARREAALSAARYWLDPSTWKRAWDRLVRMWEERRRARAYGSRYQILEEEAERVRRILNP